jgi:hypothetical protein
MDLKRIRERAHARHLARRGDAMLGAQEFWDGIFYLSRELIPEDDREISRDLFALIAYSWGVAAEKGRRYDPFDVLCTIRDRAWLGYADIPALIEQVRRDLPRAEVAGRMAAYFGELAAKRGTYLFLPIVSRIDRHQLGPLPQRLQLDRTMADYSLSRQATAVRQLFMLAPGIARERDLFFHALLTGSWNSGVEKVVSPQELSGMAAPQLRRLYEQPDQALAAVRVDAATHGAAARSIEILEEIGAERNRPLLLETLFIAENMATGPQHFAHAFEIEERFI